MAINLPPSEVIFNCFYIRILYYSTIERRNLFNWCGLKILIPSVYIDGSKIRNYTSLYFIDSPIEKFS